MISILMVIINYNYLLCSKVFVIVNLINIFSFTEKIKIVYEVISIDSWSRERNEGFAMSATSIEAGRRTTDVNCIRALGEDSLQNRLERFFIGDRRPLMINEFYGIHTADSIISSNLHGIIRYGNKTASSGRLGIITNVIIQKNVDKIKPKKLVRKKNELNVIGLLAVYQEARKKLEEISDNTK